MNRLICLATSAVTLSIALAACSEPVEEPTARIDLRGELGQEADVVAVTVSPDDGKRFVFDRASGLYEVSETGEATMVMAIGNMPDPGVEVRLPYTDLVALGDDKFAVTAIGDGFLLDTRAATMSLHFCYEPDFIPEEFTQRTDAVTFDAGLDKIIAQPQTFNELDEAISSDIGYYDRTSGADESWFPLNVGFVAGGMAVDASGELYLGAGATLYRYDTSSNRPVTQSDLSRYGVDSIAGLAFDASGTLLVVDGASQELLEID